MPHYYNDDETPLNPYKIRVRARDCEIEIWTGSSVFSRDKLDNGSRLLIGTCEILPGWKVHDLGCGYGVVGLIIKKTNPSCEVWCSDVSKRAISLTRRTAKDKRLDITCKRSDSYAKIDEEFDTVLLNPPYVAGRKVVFKLIEDAKEHLRIGGLLQVVARHQKGGKMIKKKMEELFGNCDDSRKQSGFRVYISEKT